MTAFGRRTFVLQLSLLFCVIAISKSANGEERAKYKIFVRCPEAAGIGSNLICSKETLGNKATCKYHSDSDGLYWCSSPENSVPLSTKDLRLEDGVATLEKFNACCQRIGGLKAKEKIVSSSSEVKVKPSQPEEKVVPPLSEGKVKPNQPEEKVVPPLSEVKVKPSQPEEKVVPPLSEVKVKPSQPEEKVVPPLSEVKVKPSQPEEKVVPPLSEVKVKPNQPASVASKVFIRCPETETDLNLRCSKDTLGSKSSCTYHADEINWCNVPDEPIPLTWREYLQSSLEGVSSRQRFNACCQRYSGMKAEEKIASSFDTVKHGRQPVTTEEKGWPNSSRWSTGV